MLAEKVNRREFLYMGARGIAKYGAALSLGGVLSGCANERIARVDVADPERYKAYIAANAQPLKKYGARFLVRSGRFENPEGIARSRNVVIEFPSYQAALDCYKSSEYQAAIKLRQAVSTGDFVIIEGYEGPQPS
jgi:uncharacterized protein (DUF1330 family)